MNDIAAKKYPTSDSNIGPHDQEWLNRQARGGTVSTTGATVKVFEASLAEKLGVESENVLATNSGTSALHLALLSAGVGPGDEVIMPALSFVATAEVVRYCGATPVFVDVRRDTWTMDGSKAHDAMTERTKAFLPVHLYGLVADTWDLGYLVAPKEGYLRISGRRGNIPIIEDACQALGAFDAYGRPAGTIGDYAAFSFNGNKVITTGAGGALIGKDLSLARKLASHGRDDTGFHEMVGYNYGMPALNAALGMSQLGQLEKFLLKKIRFREIYVNELAIRSKVIFQGGTVEPWSYLSSWWLTAAVFPEWDAEDLQEVLQEKGIMTRRVFRPLNHFPPYADGKVHENAECIYHHGLCLPSSTTLSERDIMTVCKEIKGVL